jgi:hypothetical protein
MVQVPVRRRHGLCPPGRFCTDIRKKCIGPVRITGQATGQMEARRIAQAIDGSVDLGAQPDFASSDCLVLVFLTAPALC